MVHVLIQHHHLILKAVSPDMVSTVVSAVKHLVSEKTISALPAGHHLKDVIYVFGTAGSKDAGKMVVQKIEEATATHKLVEGIHAKFQKACDENRELRATTARLEKLQAEGLMKFTAKVDAKSFLILCAILACGDVAKASRALKLGDSTVRDVVRSWKNRGPAYAVMTDLVRWRKKVGGKYTVPFNDAVLYEQDATTGDETIFSNLLDAVLSMTENNWQDICAELEAILRKQMGQ